MKKIYTFTLDDDVPLCDDVASNIRELAYWFYGEISNIDRQIICFEEDNEISREGLIRNELYDIPFKGNYHYLFTSDSNKMDKRMYEPFMIDDRTFGFTVYDGSITDEEILSKLNGVLKLLRFDYKFNINSITYDDKNLKNRFIAIDKVVNNSFKKQENVKRRIKVKMSPIMTILGL